MSLVEIDCDFWVCDDGVVHDQIGNQGADFNAVIEHEVGSLLFDFVAAFDEFQHQGPFVKLFFEPRFQRV